ncbi:hypothetical protein SAMN05428949_6448 [Chitinophaga sp. YR627]|nr:hypothetical protein SAMN05428949_6448 [Chitinophaga sp. YR627]
MKNDPFPRLKSIHLLYGFFIAISLITLAARLILR